MPWLWVGGDRLTLFPAVREHRADVGGMTPGSLSGLATEIYQEGVRIPPIKIRARAPEPGGDGPILHNMRVPDERLGDFHAGFRMVEGDVLVLQSAGGGGYGDPLERPAERVVEDVREGYVTRERARDAYGVVVRDALALDVAATRRARVRLAARRMRLIVVETERSLYAAGTVSRRRICPLDPDDAARARVTATWSRWPRPAVRRSGPGSSWSRRCCRGRCGSTASAAGCSRSAAATRWSSESSACRPDWPARPAGAAAPPGRRGEDTRGTRRRVTLFRRERSRRATFFFWKASWRFANGAVGRVRLEVGPRAVELEPGRHLGDRGRAHRITSRA